MRDVASALFAKERQHGLSEIHRAKEAGINLRPKVCKGMPID